VRGCTPEESCDGRGGCGKSDTPAQVTGLPLSDSTVVYYYTYGSVLAALSRPKQNYCPEAHAVFDEVKAQYGADPTIAGIIQSGELICQSLTESGGTPVPVLGATLTPLPASVSSPTLLPSPYAPQSPYATP
jgi:hypothetical protein